MLKHLLPPPLALMYVRAGRYGMLILFALLAFGTPVLRAWMRPVDLGTNAALRAVYTYIIPSPWTT